MAAARRCSECPTSLAGKQATAKTCSGACAKRRARRLARKKTRKVPEHLAGMHDAVTKASDDAVQEAVQRELAPIVREAMTEDVLMTIDKLMSNVLPSALMALESDINGDDKELRQKAYTLLMKYTLGNPSVAPKPDAPTGQQVVVNFELPRAGDQTQADAEAQADEVKVCVECSVERPVHEFVAGSDRCQPCHDALQARVDALFPAGT